MATQENPNIQKGGEVSQKFEFYLLALVFTILGFSVQTSVFTRNFLQISLEMSALIFLLLSGLAGLFRIEGLGVAFLQKGQNQQAEINLHQIEQGLQGQEIKKKDGSIYTIEELQKFKKEIQKTLLENNNKYKEIEKATIDKYKIHTYLFVLGLACLVVSRIFYNLILLS